MRKVMSNGREFTWHFINYDKNTIKTYFLDSDFKLKFKAKKTYSDFNLHILIYDMMQSNPMFYFRELKDISKIIKNKSYA